MSDMLKMQMTDTSRKIIADMAGYPEQVEHNVEKTLDSIGLDIRNNIMEKMATTKRAPWKYKRGKSKWHHPSMPGSPPAPDNPKLMESFEVYRVGGHLEVGTNILYAKFLEKGTSKMAARPFLEVGMADIDVEDRIKTAIMEGFGQ